MTNLNKALQDTVGFGVEEFIEKAKKVFPDFEICYWELIKK